MTEMKKEVMSINWEHKKYINDGAETNTGQLNRVIESSVKRDWPYADMIKYFKKKLYFHDFEYMIL